MRVEQAWIRQVSLLKKERSLLCKEKKRKRSMYLQKTNHEGPISKKKEKRDLER